MIRLSLVVALAAILLAPPAPVGAATNQRLGAVDIACDDDRFCVAAMTARDSSGEVASVLQLSRRPESRSRWMVAISTLGALADRDRPVALAVDGGVGITLRPGSDYAPFVEPGTFYVLSQGALDRLMVDLRVGFEARFSYIDIAGAPHTDRYSLDGLSAALAEIDRQQGRIAGDRRAGPPVDLPPAPEVDRQVLVARDGVPPRLVEWHAASSTCEALDSPTLGAVDAIIGPLSDTAMLYALPCFLRAGRPSYRLYLIESGEIGGMHTLVFAAFSRRFGWTGAETLESVGFDPAERVLTATDLGGVGGCPYSGRWSFDDFAFRLDEMRVPEDCTSAPADPADWPAVFTR
jgi:hypothetical protein